MDNSWYIGFKIIKYFIAIVLRYEIGIGFVITAIDLYLVGVDVKKSIDGLLLKELTIFAGN